jgi:hypothetical protein
MHTRKSLVGGSAQVGQGSSRPSFGEWICPSLNIPGKLFILHGTYSDSLDTIALTDRGYGALYANGSLFGKLLWLLCASRSLVFIGFGFEDADFLYAFRASMREMEGYPGPCHFAIVGLKPEEEDGPRR